MGIIAIDYSFSRPAPAALKAAGVGLVIRYTTGAVKGITKDEAQALRAAGLGIALVHETTAVRVNVGGLVGGKFDATQANFLADSIGYPSDAVIFYADDTTPDFNGAAAYFQGVRQAQRRPVGWYGGLQVGLQLKAAGLVDVVWVANATSWSGFQRASQFPELRALCIADSRVAMLQHMDKPLAGVDPAAYDYDEVLQPFPAWGVSLPAPSPAPVPVPPPPPVTTTTTDLGDIEVKHTVIRPVTLDSKGDGYIPTPPATAFVLVQAGPEPTPENGYLPRPTASLTADGKFIVLLGGAPHGEVIVNAYTV